MHRGLIVLLALAACSAQRSPVSHTEARRFAATLDARTARIVVGTASYAAANTVIWVRGRQYVQTVIRGDSRDHIGDAVSRVFHEARQIGSDLHVPCETNGGFDQTVVSWNGRQVECRLLSVGF